MTASSDSTAATVIALMDDLGDVLDRETRATGLPAAAMAISHGERTVRAAGGAELLDADQPLRLGCGIRPFTATLVAQRIIRGDLRLEDDFIDVLPGVSSELRRAFSGVRIEHLLTDTHGLSAGGVFPGTDLAGALERMAKQPRRAEPGEIPSYGPLGYLVLGVVLESLHGRRYRQILETELLAPLRISFAENREPGAFMTAAGRRRIQVPFAEKFAESAGGSAFALSVGSLLEFLRLHLGHRPEITAPDVPRLMRSREQPMPVPGGYVDAVTPGWNRYSAGCWGHHGMSAGHQVLTRFYPAEDLAFVLATPAYPAFSLAARLFGDNYERCTESDCAPDSKTDADLQQYCGRYENSSGVADITCMRGNLEIRVRAVGDPMSEQTPTRYAEPVGGNDFRLVSLSFFGSSRISFVRTPLGNTFLWDGTAPWRKMAS